MIVHRKTERCSHGKSETRVRTLTLVGKMPPSAILLLIPNSTRTFARAHQRITLPSHEGGNTRALVCSGRRPSVARQRESNRWDLLAGTMERKGAAGSSDLPGEGSKLALTINAFCGGSATNSKLISQLLPIRVKPSKDRFTSLLETARLTRP